MTDIAELFARDPQEYSKQDIDEIIAYERANRNKFKAGVAPTKPKISAAAAEAAKSVDLSDLGL